MIIAFVLEILRTGLDWVWHTSLAASVLIALVLLVQWLGGKRLPPRVGYVLWMLVLLRLIMPVVPASRLSVFNLQLSSVAIDVQPAEAAPVFAPGISVPDGKERTALRFAPAVTIAPSMSFGWRELTVLGWPAGALGMFGLALAFHLKTLRKLRHERPITEPRIVKLMDECRTKLGIREDIPVLSAAFLQTPAVFGWWRARILLPPEMAARLETCELRMVLLHELVHIKRHDVLQNWIVILVRALHWFNPLVWLAVKRLRAERELVCDGRVLTFLTGEDERRAYGETLLKLLSGLSRPALNPSLVPFLTNRQTIKRRITMIVQHRPTSRVAITVAVALLTLLCCLTFTRAAAQQTARQPGAETNSTNEPRASASAEAFESGIKTLERQIQEQDAVIRDADRRTAKLRGELGLSAATLKRIADGSSLEPETLAAFLKARADISVALFEQRSVLNQLKGVSRDQLRNSIMVVRPDPVLQTLMQDHALAESKLIVLTNTQGPRSIEVLSAKATTDYLDRKIETTVDGIVKGLELKIRALEAQQSTMAKEIEEMKAVELGQVNASQAYFQAKMDLDNRLKFREALSLKLAQERVDAAISRFSGVDGAAKEAR
jgi:beta-lactamase regulating signal transducer with metallopeptidase domain